MRIFNRDRKKKAGKPYEFTPMPEEPSTQNSDSHSKPRSNASRQDSSQRYITIIGLFAGGIVIFVFGIFVGFFLKNQPGLGLADQSETRRVNIPIADDDGARGPEDAPVLMVEFTDYQCPYCQRYYTQTFNQIIETYGDQIRYVVKDLPLVSIHPEAAPAAVAAHCANEQGMFWAYHDLLFSQVYGLNSGAYLSYAEALQLDMPAFNECLDSGRYDRIVLADTSIIEQINAPMSTPTFFINGQYLAGAQPFSVFADLIDAELARAGE